MSSSEFGLDNLSIKDRHSKLILEFGHYSTQSVVYKFIFENFIAFDVREEGIAQEKNVYNINFDEEYKGIIIEKIIDGEYLKFLKEKMNLQLFIDIEHYGKNVDIQEYRLYDQDFIIDVISLSPPIILVEEQESN